MRRNFILFLLLGLILHANKSIANSIYGKYGMQESKNISDYQKYIGQTVVYLAPIDGSRIAWGQTFTGKKEKEYVITKVTGSPKRLKIHLKEKDGKLKARMDLSYDVKHNYGFPPVPLLLIEKYNNDKPHMLGKQFYDKLSSEEFTCIDLDFRNKPHKDPKIKPYPQIFYILKSRSTDLEMEIPIVHARSGTYESVLHQVVKPTDESIRYGKTTTTTTSEITKYGYADNIIDITIYADSMKYLFNIRNVSDNTIKVIWNEAVFVDFEGKSSKIMRNGVNYSQKNEDQPPSIIISNASIDEVAIPTVNIKYITIPFINESKWIVQSMYLNADELSPGQLKLMLPIQIKDTINEYIFVFNVDWVYNYPIEKVG